MATSKTLLKRLTQDEFDKAVSRLRLSQANKELAHRVLVEGVTGYAVSRETQVKPQVIYAAIARIRRAHSRNQEVAPAGWVSVTVNVPIELEPEVRAIERRAQDDLAPASHRG